MGGREWKRGAGRDKGEGEGRGPMTLGHGAPNVLIRPCPKLS